MSTGRGHSRPPPPPSAGRPEGVTPRILLVEDDDALRDALLTILRDERYEVTAVADGAAGTRALTSGTYEILLLDLGLPFVDGWHILRRLEPVRLPSVIVISARGEERDKVRALDMGADDYLAKPFGADELLARIRVALRRANSGAVAVPTVNTSAAIRLDDVVIDLGRRVVLKAAREVRLSPTEFALLGSLARQAGVVVDHETLLREVWGGSHLHERNYLWTFVQRLRQKLEDDPASPRIIVRVGSRGYRLGGPLTA